MEPVWVAIAALWTFDRFMAALFRERRRNLEHNRRLAGATHRRMAEAFRGLGFSMALYGASTLEASEALAGLARVLSGERLGR